jgi:glycosyltransferase involved in cell wall biosynthesis
MRIAHFIHRYPPAIGGSEAFFARLSRFLASQGHEVSVFTSQALDLEAFWRRRERTLPVGIEQDDGVTVRRYAIRHWWGRRYLLKAASLLPFPWLQCLTLPCNPIMPEMWRDCGRPWPVDLVHASAFPYTFPIACGLRLARMSGVPFVLTPFAHLGDPTNPKDRTRRAYLSRPMRFLLHAADAVFVQTELEKAALRSIGLPEERLHLLGMGVDPGECTEGDRDTARRRWQLPARGPVIGHLANQSHEKGTIDLLLAAERLWSQGVQFHVLLAGPTMANFERFWKQFSNQNVRQLGVLAEAEKPDFYAACDIFALPSRSDSFGIVLLEAWANGIPCVGYRAGGLAEVIRDGVDGLLATCGNIDELAACLRSLVGDADLGKRLGAAGQVRVLRDHAWQPRLENVRHVYAALSASSPTAEVVGAASSKRR